VTLHADAQADHSLPSEARLALFHVAQEALSNAAKHSRASQMNVQLLNEADAVVLSLTDNGRGFVPEQAEQRMGHGLVNMRERARALGGQLSIRSAAGGGTEVRISIPKVPSRAEGLPS
jgi:signal transduction histidine kinase